MSKGLGKTQMAVLLTLAREQEPITLYELAHAVYQLGDLQPSRAHIEATRRAVKGLTGDPIQIVGADAWVIVRVGYGKTEITEPDGRPRIRRHLGAWLEVS